MVMYILMKDYCNKNIFRTKGVSFFYGAHYNEIPFVYFFFRILWSLFKNRIQFFFSPEFFDLYSRTEYKITIMIFSQ